MNMCAICGSPDGLWLVYPYMGNKLRGEKLCPEHLKLYEEDYEKFKMLIVAKPKKKGRK